MTNHGFRQKGETTTTTTTKFETKKQNFFVLPEPEIDPVIIARQADALHLDQRDN